MAKKLEEENYYYDEINKKFYTKDGPATLVSDRELQKTEEKETEMEK